MKYIKNLITGIFVFLVKFYKYVISPHTPRSCRYDESCSTYALEAYQRFNPFYATVLTIKRVSSCHPFGGSGYDPVPESKISYYEIFHNKNQKIIK